MLKLEPLMVMRAQLKDPVAVGSGPYGNRQIYDVTGGSFEGPRLKGKVLPSGGDWLLLGSDGVGRLTCVRRWRRTMARSSTCSTTVCS